MRYLTARLENSYCSITVANYWLIMLIRFGTKVALICEKILQIVHLVIHVSKIPKYASQPKQRLCTLVSQCLEARPHKSASANEWVAPSCARRGSTWPGPARAFLYFIPARLGPAARTAPHRCHRASRRVVAPASADPCARRSPKPGGAGAKGWGREGARAAAEEGVRHRLGELCSPPLLRAVVNSRPRALADLIRSIAWPAIGCCFSPPYGMI
jgi:hypothetical protein